MSGTASDCTDSPLLHSCHTPTGRAPLVAGYNSHVLTYTGNGRNGAGTGTGRNGRPTNRHASPCISAILKGTTAAPREIIVIERRNLNFVSRAFHGRKVSKRIETEHERVKTSLTLTVGQLGTSRSWAKWQKHIRHSNDYDPMSKFCHISDCDSICTDQFAHDKLTSVSAEASCGPTGIWLVSWPLSRILPLAGRGCKTAWFSLSCFFA